MPRRLEPESWGRSTIPTACPLDCPDSCSLDVTVENGRIIKIDGSDANPATRDFICAKVRRFTDRVYGEDRLLYPAIRKGAKGQGVFTRVSWDEALDHIADRMRQIRDRFGAEAILPFSYGGSNGLLTQDTTDATLFRAFGTSRLARTVCAAPTGAAATGLYGKMAGVTYQDYVHARLIVLWGVNPAASGIHLVPYLKEARAAGARLVVIDPRATSLARQADLHLAPRPGTDLPIALAIHNHLFERGFADVAFLDAHTKGAERLRARAAEWPMSRAAEVSGVEVELIQKLADLYVNTSPAVVRCGWGLERNRNGGSAAAAIMALPAVAGKFGVRGGGYSMSNSLAFGLRAAQWADTPEPPTRIVNMNHLGRALAEYDSPPIKMLFVYNCNPLVTMPQQNRVLEGLQREDLFTVVYEQVFTDTARYADIVLPATMAIEHSDLLIAYGHLYVAWNEPAVAPPGECLPTTEIFRRLARRMELDEPALYDSDEEIARQLLGSGHPSLDGITLEELKSRGWMRLRLPDPFIPFATEKIARLRIGIGDPARGAVDHVLSRFGPDEEARMPILLDASAEAVETWARDGTSKAANRFNSFELQAPGDGDPEHAGPAPGEIGGPADDQGIRRTKTGWRRILPGGNGAGEGGRDAKRR